MLLNVQTLRDKIEAALTGVLGVATYSNGFVRPAIFIGNPPNGITITGLSIILPIVPITDKAQHLSDTILKRDRWKIILEKREGCTASQFQTACDRLTTFFHNTNLVYLEQNSQLGSYTQAIITFKHCDLYPVYRG